MFIKIINSYNNVYLSVNELNKVVGNESNEHYINILKIKEPFDSLNKELINSKSLLENFFVKLNENKKLLSNNPQSVIIF